MIHYRMVELDQFLQVLKLELSVLEKAQSGAKLRVFFTTYFGQIYPIPEEHLDPQKEICSASIGSETFDELSRKIESGKMWDRLKEEVIKSYKTVIAEMEDEIHQLSITPIIADSFTDGELEWTIKMLSDELEKRKQKDNN